ncbi:MAG: hypothetical protein ACRD0H_26685 [Actinomycetes bacterium]
MFPMDLGQVAYGAYMTSYDGDPGDGTAFKAWDGLAPAERERWRMIADGVKMFVDSRSYQDDCLLAVEDGKPVPAGPLGHLPPWRAVMVARIAAKAGVPLERGTVGQLAAEARAVTGSGTLGPWWERPDQEG